MVEGQVLDVTSFLSEHPGFQPGGKLIDLVDCGAGKVSILDTSLS